MIHAELTTQGAERQLTLRGHAAGEPAVCAAASSLTFALARWLQAQRAEELAFRLVPGNAWVQCAPSPGADAAFGLVAAALDRLARSYPDHFTLRIERRTP